MNSEQSELEERLERVLQSRVRPLIRQHGGDIRISGFDKTDGTAYVELSGACAGCASADLSTRDFVEKAFCEAEPEVRRVIVDYAVSAEMLDFARRILRGSAEQ